MNKVKVCHFTSAHKPDDIRIFHKECTSLAEAGYEVFLVSRYEAEVAPGQVTFVHTHSKPRGRLSRMLFTAKEVYQKAKSLDADIYHFHDPELLRFGLKLKRQGKKVIYDVHEDVPRQIMAKDWIPGIFRKLVSFCFEKYENYVAKRLTAIVVSTPHIRKRFLSIHPHTVDVCNYPLMNELMEPAAWDHKPNEVCYVGGISVVRGINELMDALPFIPGIRLNLAGNFSTPELENEIKAKPSWNDVVFYGYVGRTELLSIFQRSRIGMVTLLPTPNHMESLPIKMFEYMSAGIPVICSNFPLWEEIVGTNQCGMCVDPSNPQLIAASIRSLLDNPDGAKTMGENGRRAILEKYNWDIEKNKLFQLYRGL